MQTFLLLSENKNFIEKELSRFKDKLHVSPFDIIETFAEISLGIDVVRQLLKNSQLTPFKGSHRLIIIRDINKATREAQNALLKFLEESLPSTVIILLSDNLQNILPTVVSRCQIIKEKTNHKKNNIKNKDFKSIFLKLLAANIKQRLSYVQKEILQRQDAYIFVKNLTDLLESELTTSTHPLLDPLETARLLKKVSSASRFLDNNVNYKLVLDILLLGLPKV